MESSDIKIVKIDNLSDYNPTFSRRDLYRICIVSGESILYFGEETFEMSGIYLFLGNVNTPYSWVMGKDKKNEGYSCLFTQDYLKQDDSSLVEPKAMALFRENVSPLYRLSDPQQISFITLLFERIAKEIGTNNFNKKEIIIILLQLIFFETFKLIQNDFELQTDSKKNASKKIYSEFMTLLNSQFPIVNKNDTLLYKIVVQYAEQLSVHPNYLNRMVKVESGKTVLKIINERIIKEAKILLKHTDWSISEIAYALGFEYPSYFDNIFKKIAGISPKIFREMQTMVDQNN